MQDPGIFQPTKPHFPEQEKLKCPHCDSSNTKFCYYNNYNLSQSRHFCKNCRRYWTKGSALRNIPVGGGTRKNTKRASNPKHSSSSSTSSLATSNSVVQNTGPEHDPNRIYGATVGDQDHRILDISVFREHFWFKRERATERGVCSVAHNRIFPLHCGTAV